MSRHSPVPFTAGLLTSVVNSLSPKRRSSQRRGFDSLAHLDPPPPPAAATIRPLRIRASSAPSARKHADTTAAPPPFVTGLSSRLRPSSARPPVRPSSARPPVPKWQPAGSSSAEWRASSLGPTPKAAPQATHTSRVKREVQLLYDVWAQQQAPPRHSVPRKMKASPPIAATLARNYLCTFDAVLRLYFPLASKAELKSLQALVRTREDDERRSWQTLASGKGDKVISLFGSMDADGSSTIDIKEFQATAAAAGLDGDEVAALFQKYDADGNGALDLEEFTGLVAQNGFIMRKFDKILTIGAERKEAQARADTMGVREMFRPRTSGRGSIHRPSLADLSQSGLPLVLEGF